MGAFRRKPGPSIPVTHDPNDKAETLRPVRPKNRYCIFPGLNTRTAVLTLLLDILCAFSDDNRVEGPETTIAIGCKSTAIEDERSSGAVHGLRYTLTRPLRQASTGDL